MGVEKFEKGRELNPICFKNSQKKLKVIKSAKKYS